MAKKDKKKKAEVHDEDVEVQEEVLLATTNLEQEPEEVQYTDTSYTSASFESLPPPVVVEEPKSKRSKYKSSTAKVSKSVRSTSSPLFDWSEEFLPEEEEQKVEEKAVRKKVKKGKKKEKPELPTFEKPPTWKKMTKAEREAWLAQKLEEWKAEKEAEKQAILAGAKEKRAALARERAELMAKDHAMQEVRRDILVKTVARFQRYERQLMEFNRKKQLEAEWQQYLRCDGLPDPRVVTQMNDYLHLWRVEGVCEEEELERKCVEVLPMLGMLDELVVNSRQYTPMQIQNYNEVRLELRAQLLETIQCTSYTLLRDLENRLNWTSIKNACYEREFKALKLNIWVAIPLPTRKPKPVEPEREPVELSFPSMQVTVKLPTLIDGTRVCMNAARSMIDLLSESSRSFALTSEMPNRYEDLYTFNAKEHEATYKLKSEQDEVRSKFYKDVQLRITQLEAFIKANPYLKNEKEKEELDNLNMSEPPAMLDPRAFIAQENEQNFAKYLKSCLTRTRGAEINLRKYRICNGVLNLDLLVTPPQPKKMAGGITLSTLPLPKRLQAMEYQVQYRAPSPPPPGVTRRPEEIEAEIKKTEAQYQKLALVFMELPQDVMWSEPPVICQWQEPKKLWTSNYINDYKFNEDKLTVQFRTGVLWPIGIATLKYGNMPYQGWDIRPDPNSKGVIITVTGVCVTVTWLCLGDKVRLKWIANATTPALKKYFNQPYSVKRMIQIMREAACDFFPDFDGHNHVEGTCPKQWVAERHNYHAMAFLSRAYNFQWSRWNAEAGYINIVMQIREAVDRKREGKLQLLLVTPQQATILKCLEVSQEYNTEPILGLEFFPDLFTLNMKYGSMDARRTTFSTKFKLVETVFEMLQELKLSSYS